MKLFEVIDDEFLATLADLSVGDAKQLHRIARRKKLYLEWEKFQEKQFGRILRPDDVVKLRGGMHQWTPKELLVVKQGVWNGLGAVAAISRKNNGSQDEHNNYAHDYGIGKLRGAKLIGQEKLDPNTRIGSVYVSDKETYLDQMKKFRKRK